MALVRMDEILIPARKNKRAVGAFECWDSNSAQAITEAAVITGCPVIIQATPGEYNYVGGPDVLRRIVEIYVNKYNVQASMHLDHGTTLEQVEQCLNAGFTSVMLDASSFEYDENVRLTKEAVKMAKSYNASVEAELGHVGGSEGEVSCQGKSVVFTDPDEAAAFVKETGIDCLAVAIGTVHGIYKAEPNIDVHRLSQIAEKVTIPLVLHGGSGTPDDVISECIKLGISKVNVCTELMQAWVEGIQDSHKENTLSLAGPFHEPALKRAKSLLVEKIKLFNCN